MREADAQQRFDRVIAYAGRVHGFEPAGPSGRAYLQEATELRALAEKKIRRRDQLKEQIPIEIRAENFERAEEFIRQYRELAEDRQGFENELRQMPERVLSRDLQRAQRALCQRRVGLHHLRRDRRDNGRGHACAIHMLIKGRNPLVRIHPAAHPLPRLRHPAGGGILVAAGIRQQRHLTLCQ